MTQAIKRMLAERAKLAEADSRQHAYQRVIDDLWVMIERAAPFMDEGCDPAKWRPSDKMKLLYCVSATHSAKARERAVRTILALLDRSRAFWIAGYHPDPWWNDTKGLPPMREGQ